MKILNLLHLARPFNNLQITWFKGDDASRTVIASGDSHLSLSSDMRVLTIKSVTADDSGIYGCEGTVNSQAQPVSHQATLTVLGRWCNAINIPELLG